MKTVSTLFFSLFIASSMFAQHELTLKVEGLESSDGDICYAIYNNEQSFLKFEKVFKAGKQKAQEGSMQIEITNLVDGTYAIAIFHDENGNDKLDTNLVGIPKEPVAFSNAKMKMFGPPSFEECAFDFNTNMAIKINIK